VALRRRRKEQHRRRNGNQRALWMHQLGGTCGSQPGRGGNSSGSNNPAMQHSHRDTSNSGSEEQTFKISRWVELV
jgi:hypothetical protein